MADPTPPPEDSAAPVAPESILAKHLEVCEARGNALDAAEAWIRAGQRDAAAWLPILRKNIRVLKGFMTLHVGAPWLAHARELLALMRADLRRASELAGPEA